MIDTLLFIGKWILIIAGGILLALFILILLICIIFAIISRYDDDYIWE